MFDTIDKRGLNPLEPGGLESLSFAGARMIYLLRVDVREVTALLRTGARYTIRKPSRTTQTENYVGNPAKRLY